MNQSFKHTKDVAADLDALLRNRTIKVIRRENPDIMTIEFHDGFMLVMNPPSVAAVVEKNPRLLGAGNV